MAEKAKPIILLPYLAGFEYIVQVHQGSPYQAAHFTRRRPRTIWKQFVENNALLGHPYANKNTDTLNPSIADFDALWNGWTATHQDAAFRELESMGPSEFFNLVDPWISGFRLPQRTDDTA